MTIQAWQWSIVSGPSGVGTTIGTAPDLAWTPSVTGTYVLRLTVTDSDGEVGFDDVTVNVVASTSPGGSTVVHSQSSLTAALTLTKTPAVGNLMVLAVRKNLLDSTDAPRPPAGWQNLITRVGPAGHSTYAGIFWKIASEADADPSQSEIVVRNMLGSKGITYYEVNADLGGTWMPATPAGNAADRVVSISSRTTGIPASTVGFAVTALQASTAWPSGETPGWSNLFTAHHFDRQGGASAFKLLAAATAQESTATWTTARSVAAVIGVFAVVPTSLNQRPTARAGATVTTRNDVNVALDASLSSDPEDTAGAADANKVLSYLWEEVTATGAVITAPTEQQTAFFATGPALRRTFQVTVTDAGGLSHTAVVDKLVEPPWAEPTVVSVAPAGAAAVSLVAEWETPALGTTYLADTASLVPLGEGQRIEMGSDGSGPALVDMVPPWTRGGTSATGRVRVEAVEGDVVRVVRFADNLIPGPGGVASAVDREAVPGAPVDYRARITAVFDGREVASAWSDLLRVVPELGQGWLKVPEDPTFNVPVEVLEVAAEARRRLATSHDPLRHTTDTGFPVVVSSGWTAPSGSWTLLARNAADRARIRAAITQGRTLMLQRPAPRIDCPPDDPAYEPGERHYVEVLEDLSEAPLGKTPNPGRTVTFTWREVDAPA